MSRVRSPNYPALSLPAAIERVKAIHKSEGRNAVAREALAKAIGFGSLNGASATNLSALTKYGLLESTADGEARISDLAMRIMYPDSQEERHQAIQDAAFRPALFTELQEKWPDRSPSDDGLRSFLLRKGFGSGALEGVIQIYRDTLDMASNSLKEQNPSSATKEVTMHAETTSSQEAHVVRMSGKPFSVAFDGSSLTGSINIRSVRDFDRYMKVMQAQRVVLEAMQEDEEEGNDADLEREAWLERQPEMESEKQ